MRHSVHLLFLGFGVAIPGNNPCWAAQPPQAVAGHAAVSLGIVLVPEAQCDGGRVVLGPGVTVAEVRPGSSAERAGIKNGDILGRLGSSEIRSLADLPAALSPWHAGDNVTAVVRRNGQELALLVQFADTDVPPPAPASAGQALVPQISVPLAGAGAVACLPPMPYRELPLPDKAGELADELRGETSVSLSGDILSIIHRDSGSAVQITGSIQMPLAHIPGTDLWVLQLEMPGWNKAFFSYELTGPQLLQLPGAAGRFRGPDAISFPEERATLLGRLVKTSLHSAHLGEDRSVTVYLPPTLSPNAARGPLSVLFMVDGQSCEAFARVLEPLMLAGKVRPFAVIGVESASRPSPGQVYSLQSDRRSQEYVPGIAPDVFERHMQFFHRGAAAVGAQDLPTLWQDR